jgi:hypothetical protein
MKGYHFNLSTNIDEPSLAFRARLRRIRLTSSDRPWSICWTLARIRSKAAGGIASGRKATLLRVKISLLMRRRGKHEIHPRNTSSV